MCQLSGGVYNCPKKCDNAYIECPVLHGYENLPTSVEKGSSKDELLSQGRAPKSSKCTIYRYNNKIMNKHGIVVGNNV
jgi:hypothetical protein